MTPFQKSTLLHQSYTSPTPQACLLGCSPPCVARPLPAPPGGDRTRKNGFGRPVSLLRGTIEPLNGWPGLRSKDRPLVAIPKAPGVEEDRDLS